MIFFVERWKHQDGFIQFNKGIIKNNHVNMEDDMIAHKSSNCLFALQCTSFVGCSKVMHGYAVMILDNTVWHLCFILKQSREYIFGFNYVGGVSFLSVIYWNRVIKTTKNYFLYVCIFSFYEESIIEIKWQGDVNDINGCFDSNKCPSTMNL